MFVSLTELEYPLKTSNKRTQLLLLINLFISLIEIEYPLKTSNKRTHNKIDRIYYSMS